MSFRKVVVPGEPLEEDVEGDPRYLIFEEGAKRAAVIGVIDVRDSKKTFTPLEGAYIPKPGDLVIGIIIGVGVTNWMVDINSPYTAVLNIQDVLGRPYNPVTDDLNRILSVGDYILAKVAAFDRTRNPLLTIQGEGLGKITEGKVVEVKPTRVPRLIGKKGSMINMIMEETGCDIVVGANGRVHIKCPDPDKESIVLLAIKVIEREPHRKGLTEYVRRLIRQEKLVRGV
jgi:exosome complex component RRP4